MDNKNTEEVVLPPKPEHFTWKKENLENITNFLQSLADRGIIRYSTLGKALDDIYKYDTNTNQKRKVNK